MVENVDVGLLYPVRGGPSGPGQSHRAGQGIIARWNQKSFLATL